MGVIVAAVPGLWLSSMPAIGPLWQDGP